MRWIDFIMAAIVLNGFVLWAFFKIWNIFQKRSYKAPSVKIKTVMLGVLCLPWILINYIFFFPFFLLLIFYFLLFKTLKNPKIIITITTVSGFIFLYLIIYILSKVMILPSKYPLVMWLHVPINSLLVNLIDTLNKASFSVKLIEILDIRFSQMTLQIWGHLPEYLFLMMLIFSILFFHIMKKSFTPNNPLTIAPFYKIKLPFYLPILFGFFYILKFYPSITISCIFDKLFFICLGLYFLRSYALALNYLPRLRDRYIMNLLIIAFLFSNSLISQLMIVLGIVDNLLDLEKLIKSLQPQYNY